MDSILKVLLSKVRDPYPGVSSKVLEALGELSRVGGSDLLPHLSSLIPLIIDALQDNISPTKREAALKALGKMCGSTGWVVEPYLKYPNLLNILINIIKLEQVVHVRREAVKVMGILGALDPYKHKVKMKKGLIKFHS